MPQRKEKMIAINTKNLVLAGIADLEPFCAYVMARR